MLTRLQIDHNREEIENLLWSVNRDSIENVINYLDVSGFYEAPSSLNRHHNWRGGLAEHSLGVYKTASENGEGIPQDSIIIAGLLHDICKASKLYYDENGHIQRHHTHIHGHGYRSIKILEQCHLSLTEDERLAIRWHMGGHHAKLDEQVDVLRARQSPLWKIIHVADHWDASGKNLK